MTQLELPTAPTRPKRKRQKPSILDHIEEIMSDGNAHTLPELTESVETRTQKTVLETTVSARIRDLPKRGVKYEKWTEPGKNLFWYRVTR